MQRIKSIDIFRGIAMIYVLVGHALCWWPVPEDQWIVYYYVSYASFLGAIGFIFISGISTMISYKNRITKTNFPKNIAHRYIRKEFLTRGFFIFLLGIIYNVFVAIIFLDPLIIWKWFIIQTIGMCMILSWPFLKTSKIARIVVGGSVWVINQIVHFFVAPYAGEVNLPGVIYYILYNSPDQNVILSFFPVFLFGTIFGELIHDLSSIEDKIERRIFLKKKLLYPCLLISIPLIIVGFIFVYPKWFTAEIMSIKTNFWWLLYSFGIEAIFISVSITIEEYHPFETKKSYRFFYYYSYYSLTLFVIQNINYFFFYQALTKYNIWYFLAAAVIIYDLFLRFMYKKLGPKFSLKIQVSRLANGVTERIGLNKEELYAKYSTIYEKSLT